jgi:hypothetical protein
MAYSIEEINKIFEHICIEIESGRSLRSILKQDENMPSSSTFFIWLTEDELKSKRYELATNLRTDALFDEIVEIAYNTEEGETTKVNSKGEIETTTGDMLGHRRLKIDALKWSLSKLNPKKYGEKTDITSGGEKIQNVAPPIKVTIVKPNDDDDE